jgi:hypothetical protein
MQHGNGKPRHREGIFELGKGQGFSFALGEAHSMPRLPVQNSLLLCKISLALR